MLAGGVTRQLLIRPNVALALLVREPCDATNLFQSRATAVAVAPQQAGKRRPLGACAPIVPLERTLAPKDESSGERGSSA